MLSTDDHGTKATGVSQTAQTVDVHVPRGDNKVMLEWYCAKKNIGLKSNTPSFVVKLMTLNLV